MSAVRRTGAADGWRPGTDRRAVRHPAGGGQLRADGTEAPVVVVGGGIAGIAAATGLAERGVRVVLVEPEAELGGRVRAWPLGDGRTMSRGFHAFFRQYYNLRALLRRADPGLDHLVPIHDYPLVLADGPQDSFTGIPRTPPINLAAFVVKSPSFGLRDLARVDAGAAMELLDVAFPATFSRYDGESAAAFLDRLRFPETARHLALEVFARSFFAHPDDFAAGELVAMFHAYFLGSSEGLLFDVPDDDYETTLWGPLRRHLEGLGVEVRTGESVTGLDLSGAEDGLVGLASGEELRAAAVVLAADPTTARGLLLTAGVDDPAWLERVDAQRLAPPFAVWRLWLDRPAADGRPPFLGTSGFGPVDNVSLLEQFEAGRAGVVPDARRVGRRAARVRTPARGRSARRTCPAGADVERAGPPLPRAGRRATAARGVAGSSGLPAGRADAVGRPAHRLDPGPPPGPRRRRGPLRPPGGPDGARGDDGAAGREPAARRPRRPRARPVERAHGGPQPAEPAAAPPAGPDRLTPRPEPRSSFNQKVVTPAPRLAVAWCRGDHFREGGGSVPPWA